MVLLFTFWGYQGII